MTELKTYRVMFLCTANSCRSQMAEGLARHLGKGIIEPCSAGIYAHYVQPRAIEVLKETGIDISEQKSKDIDSSLLNEMDIVITLCGHAEDTCPATPPEVKRLHWSIDDPVLTKGTEEVIMADFRRARDEIKAKITTLIEKLKKYEL
jgi:arsenate reductase